MLVEGIGSFVGAHVAGLRNVSIFALEMEKKESASYRWLLPSHLWHCFVIKTMLPNAGSGLGGHHNA